MCGRARCTLRADDIPRACHLNGRPLRSVDLDRYRPSYNFSPGRVLPVVRREDGAGSDGAVLHSMKWGLVPSFTKKSEKPDHYKMFNARSESICEKASFRRLIPNNRCLVAVEGFYEWKKDGSKRQPYYIHFKDGRPLVFAALYDSWKNSEGEILYTFTIVTTSSSSALEWLHDRMPVILGDKESTDAWLLGSSSSKFETVLKPYEDVDLAWYPVTPAMGKPSFDGPECIMEIKLRTEETMPISKFFSKKGSNSKQESNSQVASMCGEPIKTHQPGSLKVEPETEDNLDHSSLNDKGNEELKPDASTDSHGVANLPVKRDYEVFLDDAKPFDGEAAKPQTSPVRKKGSTTAGGSFDGEAAKPQTSPVRKKGSATAGGNKQPTLFSYFGKR